MAKSVVAKLITQDNAPSADVYRRVEVNYDGRTYNFSPNQKRSFQDNSVADGVDAGSTEVRLTNNTDKDGAHTAT